ncbi:MAG: hypothetical protein K9H25_09730 [Rhodospirillum sp.]|nr:hypothetical protein [Rhodospirillum sp.]MCF8491682.1 hypothetical protein [Rhodospirillum sp.]MCF8501071.1 hypothetical protein [Rhodospirillum sp.]
MTPEEFKALIDVHGTDLIKWPHGRRVAATALMGADSRARDLFAKSREFDVLLRAEELGLSEGRREALTDGIMARIVTMESVSSPRDAATSEARGVASLDSGMSLSGLGAVLAFPRPAMVLAYATLGLALGIGMGLGLLPTTYAVITPGLVEGVIPWIS